MNILEQSSTINQLLLLFSLLRVCFSIVPSYHQSACFLILVQTFQQLVKIHILYVLCLHVHIDNLLHLPSQIIPQAWSKSVSTWQLYQLQCNYVTVRFQQGYKEHHVKFFLTQQQLYIQGSLISWSDRELVTSLIICQNGRWPSMYPQMVAL